MTLAQRVTVREVHCDIAMSGHRKRQILLDNIVIAERISPVSHADAVSIAGAHLFPAPNIVHFNPTRRYKFPRDDDPEPEAA